ncbi:type II toxin-antitoxin system HicA family toxin [Sulfoacidibacillus ferrooxidans]
MRVLVKCGCIFLRQRGSHQHFLSSRSHQVVTVPMHSGKTINPKT